MIDSAAIPCPLCDYDLRGLLEPRCPECGAMFTWEDLTDPARRVHPYLFEHHPERKFTSFVQTILNGFRPWRFWKSLHPQQAIYRNRLAMYWFVCCLPFALTFGSMMLRDLLQFRNAIVGQLQTSPMESQQGAMLVISGFALLTPPTIFAIMMIFQTSMYRSGVRAAHLFRVAVYSADAIFLPGVAFLGFVLMNILLDVRSPTSPLGRRNLPIDDDAMLIFIFALLAAIGLMTLRLSIAMKRYLQFRHALGMAISVQIIAILMLIEALVLLNGNN